MTVAICFRTRNSEWKFVMNSKDENVEIREIVRDESCSGLKKYAMLAVGKPSIGGLICYELIMLFFSGVFGGLGIVLRRVFYGFLLGGLGRNVTIGRNVVIRGGPRVFIGDNVMIGDDCVLDARGENAEIKIGDDVVISRNTIVRARNAVLDIGNGSDIGANCLLGTDSRLSVGKEVLIGAYTYLCAGGNHCFKGKEICVLSQGVEKGDGVSIGDGAWIGARVTVLDSVSIGKGAVIGAHSLVKKSIPEMSVAFGTPAEVQRQRVS